MLKFIQKIWYRLFPSTLKIEKLVPDLKDVDTEKIVRTIKPGDIVIAAMNIPLIQLLDKSEDHRLRPYIIAQKDHGKFFGYCGSSKKNRYANNSFYLSSDEYEVWKSGWISLERCFYIPEDYIISVNDHLKNKDISKINSIIRKQRNINLKEIQVKQRITERSSADNKGKQRKKNLKEDQTRQRRITEGSVVENHGKLYYVYELTKPAKFFTLASQKAPVKVNFNNKTYYINPDTVKKVKGLVEYKTVGSLPKNIRNQIRDYQEKSNPKQ